jgi:hypothetical protein
MLKTPEGKAKLLAKLRSKAVAARANMLNLIKAIIAYV